MYQIWPKTSRIRGKENYLPTFCCIQIAKPREAASIASKKGDATILEHWLSRNQYSHAIYDITF